MQYVKLLFLFSGLVLLFSACGDDDETSAMITDDALDFMPLEVGAYWVYDLQSDPPAEPYSPRYDTIEVVASYADGEDTIFELEGFNSFLDDAFIPNRLRLSDGRLYYDTEDNTNPYLTVDVADAENTIYTEDIPLELGIIRYTYRSSLEDISTPAGSFSCINMEGEIVANDPTAPAHNNLISNFFAEGVGMVKARRYFWANGSAIEIELIDYFLP